MHWICRVCVKKLFWLWCCSPTAVLCAVKSAPIMHRSPRTASNWCFNGAVCWRLQRVKWVSGWLLKAVMFRLAIEPLCQFLNGLTVKVLFFKWLHYKNPNRITGTLCYLNSYAAKKKTDNYTFLHILLYHINITRCFVAQNTFPSSYYVISSKRSFCWSAGQMSQLAEDVLHVTFHYFKFYQ